MSDKTVRKIGFYGGTFDPIHLGHLNLAIEMREIHQLDEVWFSPAYRNPHRQNETPVDAEQRLKMVELAIADIPGFKLFDQEIRNETVSYTVDTLSSLIAGEGNSRFFLIIGQDAVPGFFHWKMPEKIVKMVTVLVGCRDFKSSLEKREGDPEIWQAIQKGFTKTRNLEISSTEIRKRLSLGLYCRHLLPAKVMDYIYQNHLYLIP